MPKRPKLGELLVMAGAIDQTQLGAAHADGRGKVLHLAMQDPGDRETLDAIRFHVGHNVSRFWPRGQFRISLMRMP